MKIILGRGIVVAIEMKEKKNVASCCGALGAGVCTFSMLLPVIIGTAGAATVGSMSGMPQSSGSLTGYWIIISAINSFGQPLLIASIVLILYGLKHFGRLPIVIAAVGGILLYAGMYFLSMSLPLVAISALILAVAYGFTYGPSIKRKLQRQSSE